MFKMLLLLLATRETRTKRTTFDRKTKCRPGIQVTSVCTKWQIGRVLYKEKRERFSLLTISSCVHARVFNLFHEPNLHIYFSRQYRHTFLLHLWHNEKIMSILFMCNSLVKLKKKAKFFYFIFIISATEIAYICARILKYQLL